MPQQQQQRKPPKIEQVDLPQVTEVFADAVRTMVYDGQTLRLEFCVTRMDEPASADAALTGKRYTACRVVLPPVAALQLSSKLSQILAAVVTQRGNGAAAADKAAPRSDAADAKVQAPAH